MCGEAIPLILGAYQPRGSHTPVKQRRVKTYEQILESSRHQPADSRGGTGGRGRLFSGPGAHGHANPGDKGGPGLDLGMMGGGGDWTVFDAPPRPWG